MTTTEQILWAHRVDKDLKRRGPEAGHDAARLRRSAAGLGRDGAILRSTPSIRSPAATRSIRGRPRSRTITSCSPAARSTTSRRTSAASSPTIRRCEKPYYATPGDGIFHFYFPEQGLVMPGQFIPGADSHSRAYGAYGAVGIGVGSTTLGFGWATGYIYFTVAKARRVDLRRPPPALGQRQGHRPRAAAAVGREAVAGHVGRARGRRACSCRSPIATRSRT